MNYCTIPLSNIDNYVDKLWIMLINVKFIH